MEVFVLLYKYQTNDEKMTKLSNFTNVKNNLNTEKSLNSHNNISFEGVYEYGNNTLISNSNKKQDLIIKQRFPINRESFDLSQIVESNDHSRIPEFNRKFSNFDSRKEIININNEVNNSKLIDHKNSKDSIYSNEFSGIYHSRFI